LETMRGTVGRLEDKKGQAALVEVKLRERCRGQANERARVESLRETAEREAARCERRVDFLERYVPVIAELLAAGERLAEWFQASAAELQVKVDSTRALTEGTARVMRDRGTAEADLQREYDTRTARLTELRVDQARLEDRRMQLEEELAELRRRHLSPRGLTAADVAGEDAETLAAAVERAERRRERIGPVNPLAEQECAEMEERARFLAEQRGDLEASLTRLREVIDGLDEHIERSFAEVFEAAQENFSAVIAAVFPGAKGSLKLVEEEEGSGISLEVKFPNKAPRSLSLLSGGEKAMTAIAFLFALFLAHPCPFYILDEVEASLDDINIRRFLSLVRKYRDRTQFIIITHQRQTMEVADTLYGVALESDGTSRVLSRRLNVQKGA
jgi:chromosome segregation protein